MSKDSRKSLTHLGIRSSDLPDRVIVVGDPARAQAAALLLDAYVEVGRNREYVTFRGNHGSVPVAVVSHGVGAAGGDLLRRTLSGWSSKNYPSRHSRRIAKPNP